MNIRTNQNKKARLSLLVAFAASILGSYQTYAVNTISHAETLSSNGAITLQDGTVPTGGGVTIGYFSSSAPTDADIASWTASSAVGNLISSGWIDLRTVTGGSMQANGDWDWPGGGSPGTAGTKIGGTFNWIYDASAASKQLYIFAFNSGSSGFGFSSSSTVSATSSAFTSSSFLGSSQWAVLKGTGWNLPASDGTPINLKVADVDTSGELIVGTETGANTFRDIAMVPEPSTGALLMLGAVGVVALRRLRKA
ncbi:PEP-CTERM sorting domain-containing protein [bacterium]|nr:PEP-CTERM sorting domain-containing protein [bacterium]